MRMMKLQPKTIRHLTKGLFAVSVVATTAVAGSVGFAQAQSFDRRGGAVNRFENAVARAQVNFANNTDDCLDDHLGSNNWDRSFIRRNSDNINDLRNTARYARYMPWDDTRFNDRFQRAEWQLDRRLDTNYSDFYRTLDRGGNRYDRQALARCLNDANQIFFNSVDSARRQLVNEL